MLTNFGKNVKKYFKDQTKSTFFYEQQRCSPFNSVQDALSIKLWGPFFDDFVDMSIFMILGSVDDDDKHLDIPPPPMPSRPGKKYVVRLGSSLRLGY